MGTSESNTKIFSSTRDFAKVHWQPKFWSSFQSSIFPYGRDLKFKCFCLKIESKINRPIRELILWIYDETFYDVENGEQMTQDISLSSIVV